MHAYMHTHTHTHTLTHTQSGLQCFFITKWPQEIINEGLGGYTTAQPRRMSVRRENDLFRREECCVGNTGSKRRNSFLAETFSIPCGAKAKWVTTLPISPLWTARMPMTLYGKQGWHRGETDLLLWAPSPLAVWAPCEMMQGQAWQEPWRTGWHIISNIQLCLEEQKWGYQKTKGALLRIHKQQQARPAPASLAAFSSAMYAIGEHECFKEPCEGSRTEPPKIHQVAIRIILSWSIWQSTHVGKAVLY